MEIVNFNFIPEKGWSIANFPALDSKKTLILIFGASGYINHPEPIEQLIKRYPQSQVIGCSTAGEILGSNIIDSSIVVSIVKFEHTDLQGFTTEVAAVKSSYDAGEEIATSLNKKSLKGIFVLSDGLNVNGSQLISGLNSVLPKEVIVTGGLAGDGDRFKKTWVIANRKLCTHCISAVGFYGDKIHIGHGSRGGWNTFGPERHITKSKNNILYELDGKPALSLYKEYLGELSKGLPATGLLFPLSIRENAKDSREIVRTILAVDEKNQSMTFAGDVPEGYLAKLMRANFDRLITGANEAAQVAGENQKNARNVLAVAISCVGRRLLLKQYTEEEIESTLESLPPGSKQIGFYSYGEISPFGMGYCDLHNQTMTLTTFSEE